jgi:hypothetical protein
MSEFALPEDFWRAFLADSWNKTPTLIRRPFARPFVTEQEVFAGLVEQARSFRRDPAAAFRVYVGDASLETDVSEVLPRPDDLSAESYLRRASDLLGGRPFGLVASHVQRFFPAEIWMRTREFLESFFAVAGPLDRCIDMDVFFGEYPVTPFAVHQDSADSFTYVARGPKTFYYWPHEHLADRLELTNSSRYRDLLSEGQRITAETGDIVFWPSTYWHVAHNEEATLAITIGIALYRHLVTATPRVSMPPLHLLLQECFDDWVRELYVGTEEELPGTGPRWPADLDGVLDDLRARWTDFERLARRTLLERRSAIGFHLPPPALSSASLEDDDQVRGIPRVIAATYTEDGALVCVANGQSLAIPQHPAVAELITWCKSGAIATVRELCTRFAGTVVVDDTEYEMDEAGVRAVLGELLRIRALERAKP